MKLIWKSIKWIGKLIVALIVLMLIAGACYRLLSSRPVPPGKLLVVNGTKLHIRAEGPQNSLPTIILESGANGNTDMYHWVTEGLKKNRRVVRYDREGKWFSEATKDSITPEFYARQLHELLVVNGEKPPYLLVGHSMGGPYIQIFRDLYPNEVSGMVFIDASHPEQWNRLEQSELLPKNQVTLMKAIAILSDMGLRGVINLITSPTPKADGLPAVCHLRNLECTSYSGKVYHRFLKENKINKAILQRAAETQALDSLPVLIFTATEQYTEFQKEKYRKQGIDPEHQIMLWFAMQKELKELSTNSKQLIIEANHGGILTQKGNADIIVKEIKAMVN